MDEARFDCIAKSLATSASRRTLGKLLNAGVVGGLALSIFGSDSAAGKKGDGERRNRDKGDKRKKKKKKNALPSPDPIGCAPATPTTCGAACVNTQIDPEHCGGCDQACDSGKLCLGGACFVPCSVASTCAAGVQCGSNTKLCVKVGDVAVCADATNCGPNTRVSCDDDPCPDGRACAEICCGGFNSVCVLPA